MTPTHDSLFLATPDHVAQLGAAIGLRLRRGEAILLRGGLGAGKSTLARGLVRALTTPDEEVPSPTFTLVQTYEGPAFPIAHFDLYRLSGAGEVYELGLDEALDEGAAVIEWPERLDAAALPVDRLDIELSEPPAGGRTARLTPHGAWIGRTEDLLR
jgi:tRNA threonylcarbamoyladenosine biosynthesis protein TsaE